MEELNSVQEFYSGKTIFITGATGYIGKVLIEKLLYSCSGLKEILIVVREKRGVAAQERVEKFKKLELFKRLLGEKPDLFDKVRPIVGDITQPDYGLSAGDLKYVIETTEIVFHVAASVKNEACLRYNVVQNLIGTKYVLEIAEKMKNLIHFQHVSTAFCNIEPENTLEKVYSLNRDHNALIRMAGEMTDEEMEKKSVQDNILHDFPNTYLFTKRLAEIMVEQYYPKLSLSIVRPTAVTPTYAEPFQGWVDNLNGIVGLMYAAGAGVLRSMLADPEATAEYVPVDTVVNAMILFAKKLATTEPWQEIPVMTTTCHDLQKLNIGKLFEMIKPIGRKYPLTWAVWYPDGGITKNRYVHAFNVFMFQVIPAYIVDFLLVCFRQRPFLVKVQQKLAVGTEVLKFFTLRPWNFSQKHFQDLVKDLSTSEYKMFQIDCLNFVDEYGYMEQCLAGGRQFIANEPLSTLPRARVINQIRFVLHIFFKIVFWLFLFSFLMKAFGLYEPVWNIFSHTHV